MLFNSLPNHLIGVDKGAASYGHCYYGPFSMASALKKDASRTCMTYNFYFLYLAQCLEYGQSPNDIFCCCPSATITDHTSLTFIEPEEFLGYAAGIHTGNDYNSRPVSRTMELMRMLSIMLVCCFKGYAPAGTSDAHSLLASSSSDLFAEYV
jgi:hypothetical protein